MLMQASRTVTITTAEAVPSCSTETTTGRPGSACTRWLSLAEHFTKINFGQGSAPRNGGDAIDAQIDHWMRMDTLPFSLRLGAFRQLLVLGSRPRRDSPWNLVLA